MHPADARHIEHAWHEWETFPSQSWIAHGKNCFNRHLSRWLIARAQLLSAVLIALSTALGVQPACCCSAIILPGPASSSSRSFSNFPASPSFYASSLHMATSSRTNWGAPSNPICYTQSFAERHSRYTASGIPTPVMAMTIVALFRRGTGHPSFPEPVAENSLDKDPAGKAW